jgi:hypothetical protein
MDLSGFAKSRDIANSGGSIAVSIYAPYLVWNMTGLAMQIKSKAFLRQADAVSYKLKPSFSPEISATNFRAKLHVLL